ncbi:MAG: hypothetical protein Q9207_000449 [Kuettlingeria erythrocarpa]
MKSPGGTFMFEIEKMHEIYASANTIPKVFGTIDHEIHRKRRAAISPFFSKHTVTSAEPTIYENMSLLSQKLDRELTGGGNVELRKTYLAMTTDTLAEHTFQKPLGLLNCERKAEDWRRTITAVAILTPLIKQFTWVIPLVMKLPLAALRIVVPDLARIVALRRDMNRQADAAIRHRQAASITKAVPSSDTMAPGRVSVFESILANKGLPAKEKEIDRLAQEGFVVLVAGGETTARVLTTATYHLLANQGSALRRLKDELRIAMAQPDIRVPVKVLEQLPWLTAVIKESFCITALVTSRLPLVSPKEPLRYEDWIIPPGTPVSMTLRDILLDPTIYANPLDFRPERWLSDDTSELERMNQAYVPFARGSRMCVGLNLPHTTWPGFVAGTGEGRTGKANDKALMRAKRTPSLDHFRTAALTRFLHSFALAEIHIVIACLFRRFDLALYDTIRERDIDAVRDCFIGEPAPGSLGVRVRNRHD